MNVEKHQRQYFYQFKGYSKATEISAERNAACYKAVMR